MRRFDGLKRLLVFTTAVVGFSLGSAFAPHPDAAPGDRVAALVTAGTFACFLMVLLFAHTWRAARRAKRNVPDS